MGRKFLALLAVVLLTTAFFFYDGIVSFFENVQLYAEGGSKEIFEIKLSEKELMNEMRAALLKDKDHSYHKSTLKLSPYALLEAKFVDDKGKTKEGWLLWSEVDGEIVLDTDSFETTHGFRDALMADATADDFMLMHALAKKNGTARKELLRKDLGLEKDPFERTLKNASKKNLIVILNDFVKLHLQDPRIVNFPITRITHSQVIREVDFASMIPKQFSLRKIEKMAKVAFGSNFTIRSSKEIYLPIWKLEVKKPDGSLAVSYWNAVSGAEIDPKKSLALFE